MKKIEKAKQRLNEFKNKDLDVLNPKIKQHLEQSINEILIELDEVEKINEVKSEIQKQIINPISKIIKQNKLLQWLSLFLGLTSASLAVFSVYNTHYQQPKILNEINQNTIKEIKNLKNDYTKDIFQAQNGKYGIRRNGEIIVQPEYETIIHYKPNDCYIIQKQGLYGILSKSGNHIIAPNYLEVSFFYTNTIKIKNKFGLVALFSNEGHELIPFKYQDLRGLHSRYLFYKLKDKWGILDKQNFQEIQSPVFDDVIKLGSDAQNYLVIQNGKVSIYKYPNTIIKETEYTGYAGLVSYVKDRENKMVRVISLQSNSQQGLIDINGNNLIPPKYDRIIQIENNNFILVSNNREIKYTLEIPATNNK